jgi:hypothetical protein
MRITFLTWFWLISKLLVALKIAWYAYGHQELEHALKL